jgi:hypothetical protein
MVQKPAKSDIHIHASAASPAEPRGARASDFLSFHLSSRALHCLLRVVGSMRVCCTGRMLHLVCGVCAVLSGCCLSHTACRRLHFPVACCMSSNACCTFSGGACPLRCLRHCCPLDRVCCTFSAACCLLSVVCGLFSVARPRAPVSHGVRCLSPVPRRISSRSALCVVCCTLHDARLLSHVVSSPLPVPSCMSYVARCIVTCSAVAHAALPCARSHTVTLAIDTHARMHARTPRSAADLAGH